MTAMGLPSIEPLYTVPLRGNGRGVERVRFAFEVATRRHADRTHGGRGKERFTLGVGAVGATYLGPRPSLHASLNPPAAIFRSVRDRTLKVAIAPGGASSAVIGASLRGRGASSIPPQTELPGTRRLSFLRRVDHGKCAEGRSTAPAVTKRAKRGVHPPSAVPVRDAAKCAPRGVEDEGDAVTHERIRKPPRSCIFSRPFATSVAAHTQE